MKQITDLMIFLNGSGGEASLTSAGNDLETIIGFSNQALLALYGTDVIEEDGYWGNQFLSPTQNQRFASNTAVALRDNSLNSSGIQFIEDAVLRDLYYFNDFGKLDVEVSISGINRLDVKWAITVSPGELLSESVILDFLKEEIIQITI